MTIETDRGLLELAAKVAGVKIARYQAPCEHYSEWGILPVGACDHTEFWNPLDDDGDALRLLATMPSLWALELKFGPMVKMTVFQALSPDLTSYANESSRAASIRRAIVLAAAEVGRVRP